MKLFHIHKWGQWEVYDCDVIWTIGPASGKEGTVPVQRRKCLVCNKIQEEYL